MLQRTRKGEETRERLLELAESAVLQKGFAATSIDELIAAAEQIGSMVTAQVVILGPENGVLRVLAGSDTGELDARE